MQAQSLVGGLSDISVCNTCRASEGSQQRDVDESVMDIHENEAWHTLEVTTQLNHQDADSNMSRRFGTNDRMLRYRRINSLFYSDTFHTNQLFVLDKGYMKVHGMKSRKDFPQALKLFCKEVGAPRTFVVDPHKSNKSAKVRSFCH